jgi:hypothetical protein
MKARLYAIYAITLFMNVSYVAGYEQARHFCSMYRGYSVSTDSILLWMCEVWYKMVFD